MIDSTSTQLWRLNIANCDIKEEGTTKIIADLRHNKKLIHLILDYNRFDTKDTFPPIFIDSIVTNKNLNHLSIAGCDFNKLKLSFLFDALSHNDTLINLNLSNNQLTTDDMRKFKDIFSDRRNTLNLKHLDLSSNLLDVAFFNSLIIPLGRWWPCPPRRHLAPKHDLNTESSQQYGER